KECNKAWRAFQRLLLEGIQADVKAVRADQEVIRRDLQTLDVLRTQLDRLKDTIDHRLPNEPFRNGLEHAIADVHLLLHDVAGTTRRTEDKVDTIAVDLKKILATKPELASPKPAEARALAALYLQSVAIRAEEDPLSTLVRQRLFVRDVFQEPLVAGSADPARVDVAMLSTEDDDGATDEIVDVEQALDRGFCVPWSVARNAAPSWVLLAPSGSGKSLLLRWECLVARDTCVTDEAGPVVPVRWDAVSVAAQLSGGA